VGLKLTAPEVQDGVIVNGQKLSEGILDMERGERIRYAVADPAIFIRNGGPSIAESMMRCKWRKADNKRQPGWEALHHRLRGENGIPMLYFADCCEDTIRTLPSLQHDENNPEDLDTDAEDHAADETRYAVMSRPWRPAPPISKTPEIGQILDRQQQRAMTINEMIQRAHARRQGALND
jgi:hypothetical protein